jgi:hypothetical protein
MHMVLVKTQKVLIILYGPASSCSAIFEGDDQASIINGNTEMYY